MPSRQVQERADSIAEAAAVLTAYAHAVEKNTRRLVILSEDPTTTAAVWQLAYWEVTRSREQMRHAEHLLNAKLLDLSDRARQDRPDLWAIPSTVKGAPAR